jgi:hypothetical protein
MGRGWFIIAMTAVNRSQFKENLAPAAQISAFARMAARLVVGLAVPHTVLRPLACSVRRLRRQSGGVRMA